MVSVWRNYNDIYNLNIYKIISYESLREIKTNIELKHGLLVRNNGEFEVTDLFRSLVEEGVVICYDEIQKMKNICEQQKAASVLNRYITERNNILPKANYFSGSYFISSDTI